MELGFQIPIFSGISRFLKSCILDSTSKLFQISDSTSQNFPDSRIQIPLHWATGSYHALAGCWFVASVLSLIANWLSLSRSLVSDRAATAVVSEKCLW